MFPRPASSVAVDPEPSSNEYAAWRPWTDVAVLLTNTKTRLEVVVLPEVSVATARIRCRPFETEPRVPEDEYGGLVILGADGSRRRA